MPAHIAIYDLAGDPAEDFTISLSGGEESATTTYEIWNDKENAELDTETSVDQRAKLLTSRVIGYTNDIPPVRIYAPFSAYGDPVTEERWGLFAITHFLTATSETTEGATGTMPIGTNAEIPLPDLAPQTGVRVTLKFRTPAGETADATKIKLSIVGNQASSPLAQMVSLASGSGVVPADRIAGLRSLLRGFEVTADDTDEVVIAGGQLVYEGTTVTVLDSTETFDLEDSDAVDLGADESYLVTLSATSAGAITVTKGPKAEAVTYPDKQAADIFVANLTVASADGIAVTVSQASVIQTAVHYQEYRVRDGGSLSVIVEMGDGITGTDIRQYLSHRNIVSLAASVTSRIWRLADGSVIDTLTDMPPEFGADLLALATTDTDSVTSIVDARVLIHRALTTDRIELTYRGVMTAVTPDDTLALEYAYDDFEIEGVDANLSDVDAGWTGGAIKVNILTLAPGAPAPFPEGSAGGTTIFTSFATDDRRPSIDFDATNLRATSEDHEVRRIVKGTRILLAFASTVTGPGSEPEQEIRVALVVRRYR